jgi:DeoR/GlpR family transcriptional regulator of sugar metabolism
MDAAERRTKIAEQVVEKGRVRVADLVREYAVTDTVIRRDLGRLETEGLLTRVHGGAVATPAHVRREAYGEAMRLHLAQKKRIAAAAAGLVRPGDVLVFDTGTTPLLVARHIHPQLHSGGGLTLVTNSLLVADEVHAWPAPNLTLLGGLYLPEHQAMVGPQAVAQLRQISADIAFLGAEGLDLTHGLTTSHVLMAEVDRAMAEQARKVVLTADSSKLGRRGFVPILPVDQLNLIITDAEAPAEIVAGIRARGVEIWLV